jgi:hypothetical protein
MYCLEALIGKGETLKSSTTAYQHAQIILLDQEIAMIPFSDALLKEIEEKDGSEKIEDDFYKFSSQIEMWAKNISNAGLVIYVEAEFFGGEGSQSSIAWLNGKRVFGPIHELHAINKALRLLGVQKKKAHDEFDAIGLGRHRCSNEWKVISSIIAVPPK